ncbi:mitochondrial ATP synthase g subunit-domain-containing protein [Collybia nuda]|uniref:Mitochondrial ATP synthase g subunit-domain-containing protein n=1 Tax=Collybia nuda TaxID=64659 RepID=A0A9P5XU17_9AGAR|nr:mitochondrial ATP synthase g subunit-domain-containing protein [Collybia nuda]
MHSVASSTLRHSLARSALRSKKAPFNGTRYTSSNSNASVEATQKKAQEALASAQQNAGKFWESTKKFLEPAGQKLGQMLGSYKQPLLYNLSVTREIFKHVYKAEGLQPPSIATFRSAYETLWSRAINPAYWRGAVSSGEIIKVGVYGVEAYTIFKIGEIFGRRNLIGYDLH